MHRLYDQLVQNNLVLVCQIKLVLTFRCNSVHAVLNFSKGLIPLGAGWGRCASGVVCEGNGGWGVGGRGGGVGDRAIPQHVRLSP